MTKNKIHKAIDVLFILLFLLVGFVPYLKAMDKIATQFFYLSILSFFSCLYLILTTDKVKFNFASIFLCSLSLLSILGFSSYLYAVNKSEVLIESSRILIYLFSFASLFLIINRNKWLIEYIPYIISIILIIEIVYVFERFFERYTWGSYSRDMGLRAFTGNINITAFNFLLKLPFLIYSISKTKIFIFFKVTLFSLFVFCLLLLGSRGANIVLFIILSIIVLLYFLLRAKLFLNKATINTIILGLFFGCIMNFTAFNKDKDLNVLERTTNLNNESTQQRLRFYSAAISSIIENPLFGIGIGNWKIHATKYDKPYMYDYTVPYHVHNDFLEIFAELGVFGFILFFGSIFWLLYVMIKAYSSGDYIKIQSYQIVILVFLSILVYLADSFLNFPFTRPVMQIQNLFYMGIAFVILQDYYKINSKINIEFSNGNLNKLISLLIIISTSIYTIYISKTVYESFVEQQFLTVAGNGSYKDYDKEYIFTINSKLPSITASTVPIETLKANLIYNIGGTEDTLHYMIDEGKKQNPYLPYNELTRSVLYIKQRNPDSAYVYAKKAFYDLPNHEVHFNLLMDIAEAYNDTIELEKAINYFRGDVRNAFYEKYLVSSYNVKNKIGLNESKFLEKYNSKNPDSDVAKTFNSIQEVGLKNVEDGFLESLKAKKLFESGNYREAAYKYEKASNLNPKEISYRENAANSFMQTGKDEKAIKILKSLIIDLKPKTGKAEYLLGVLYVGKEDYHQGCNYLQIAKKKGFDIPDIIFGRFCNSKKLRKNID